MYLEIKIYIIISNIWYSVRLKYYFVLYQKYNTYECYLFTLVHQLGFCQFFDFQFYFQNFKI